MNKALPKLLLIALVPLALAGCLPFVSSSDHLGGDVAWTNGVFLYVPYHHASSYGILAYGLHGPLSEKINWSNFYLKLDASALKEGEVVKLSNGMRRDRLIYLDDDFAVTSDRFSVDEMDKFRATVETHGVKSEFPCRQASSYYDNMVLPFRTEDKLIFCGQVVPAGGQAEPGPPALRGHETEAGAYLDGAIYFYNPRTPDGQRIKTGPIELSKLDGRTYHEVGKVQLPIRHEDYCCLHGAFRRGFVFSRKSAEDTYDIQACSAQGCRGFSLKSKQRALRPPDVLMVTDAGDELIALYDMDLLADSDKKLRVSRHKVGEPAHAYDY